MRVRTLSTFVQVVDSGSFSAAGRVLGLAAPVVTRDVAQLERDVGVQLLQRTTRRVFVTDEGRAFYTRARRILDEVDAALDEVRPQPDEVRGLLRVVLITLLVPFGILGALKELLDRHPDLAVQIRFSDRAVDLVKGGWDVGIHVGNPTDSTHIAHKLGTLAAGLAATPAYLAQNGTPHTPGDLADHNCLRFIGDRPQETWQLVGPDGAHHAVPVGGRLEIDNSLALSDAMRAGLGVGLVPLAFLREQAYAGELVRVLPEWRFTGFPLLALVPAGRNSVHRVRTFVAWLREFTARLT